MAPPLLKGERRREGGGYEKKWVIFFSFSLQIPFCGPSKTRFSIS